MRKPIFFIFCGLCILASFSLLTVNVRGYQISIAYCLFSSMIAVFPKEPLNQILDRKGENYSLDLVHFVLMVDGLE